MTRQSNRKLMSPRASALAKIHIGASALKMIQGRDDETYRIMLREVAGVDSAKDLDEAGINKVLAHLRACGWSDPTWRPASGAGVTKTRYERGTPAALIRWLWTDLANAGIVESRSERALRRYCGQHAGIQPAIDERDPRHLDRRQASAVIEQLKQWRTRGTKS